MDDFIIHSDDVIQHFGVKGMKWGKRLRDNHVQNLEYKYRKLGYNEEQVKQKLAKRLRNDKKYSGYKTKNPTIFFDHKNLKVASKKLLTNDTIEKDYDKTMKILSVQNNAGKVAGFSTAVAGLAAYSSHRNNNDVRKNDEEYNKKYGKKVRK
ncbi:MAG: hypothetical protein HXM02_06120 [[Eubacterium] sulci]|nr:hypothetical protein [[Eubacterium] sulci]